MTFQEFARRQSHRLKSCDCGAFAEGIIYRPHDDTCAAKVSMDEVWEEWRTTFKNSTAAWSWAVKEND